MKVVLQKLEMFLKSLFPTRISFDDGSYIEYLNREAIRYSESTTHNMEIVWFFNPKRLRGRILSRSDICRWDAPHENEPISAVKRREIEQKILKYCEKRRISLAIVDQPI